MKTIMNYLNEAKVDDEYGRNYSSFMPREIFDTILKIDPKTTVVNNQPQGIGFVAKNLLLPAYISGEEDFIEKAEEIKEIIARYYAGIQKYPKPKDFKTLADFLTFMENPDANEVELNVTVEENPIDSIYNKFWTKIPREEFNEIILLDPETTDTRIGEIARNFLLPKYSAGEHWILDDDNSKLLVKNAVKQFLEERHGYETEKQNIRNYSSIREFVDYKPVSIITAEVQDKKEGKDYIYITATPSYDVFRPLNFETSRDLAHTNNSKNVWCTAGGSSGHNYSDAYWNSYNRDSNIYEFINKKNPSNIVDNYNLALYKNDGRVREFRDGNNQNQNGSEPLFKAFLLKNPDLAIKLSMSSDPVLAKCEIIKKIVELINADQKPIIIKNNFDQYKMIGFDEEFKLLIKKVEIYDVEEILPQLCTGFQNLEEVVIRGPKVIGVEAFKSCINLSKVTLDDPLEVIESQAFANCVGLRGSIRLPDTVQKVEEKAFYGTHCKLKINKDRSTKIRFSAKDREWVNSHVESIRLN